MPKNVLVVGMARSGTSLTASIFVEKGYFVAQDAKEQLQAPDQDNPSAFWELEDLKEASVTVLEAVGFMHHNTWTSEEILPVQAEAIFSLEHREEHKDLVRSYRDTQPWMWKDPRFCYTLAYWWPLMNPDNTSVLLVMRDPNQIRRSLLRVGWGDVHSEEKSSYIRRIEDHIEFARKTIKRFDIPHIEIDYSDYARRPRETAEKLGKYFGIDLAPEDLGYKSKYNTSALRGYIGYLAEKTAVIFPEPIRKFLKRATPGFIMSVFFRDKPKRQNVLRRVYGTPGILFKRCPVPVKRRGVGSRRAENRQVKCRR